MARILPKWHVPCHFNWKRQRDFCWSVCWAVHIVQVGNWKATAGTAGQWRNIRHCATFVYICHCATVFNCCIFIIAFCGTICVFFLTNIPNLMVESVLILSHSLLVNNCTFPQDNILNVLCISSLFRHSNCVCLFTAYSLLFKTLFI